MAKFVVTGGKQRTPGHDTTEWDGYDKAVSIVFDDETFSGETFYDYLTPKAHLPEEPEASITFKSASLHNDCIVVCTTTEVLRISIKNRKLEALISCPVFNDVHHAFINSEGNYIVTSTGLDAVYEVSESGNIINEWYTLDEDMWARFDKTVDYRKVLTTKPHLTHPNHSVEIDGNIWTTQCQSKSLLNLSTRESISVPFGRVHDGIAIGDDVLFTHVNGILSKVHFPTRTATQLFDINSIYDGKKSLGWLRGLHVLNEKEVIVGFSRLRSTKYEDAVHWAKRKLTNKASYYGCHPTRLAKYDIAAKKLVWEFDLEPYDINAVFSVLPVDL